MKIDFFRLQSKFLSAFNNPSRRKKWRREWDSNPRYGFPYTRFPSERLQPLGHPSGGKTGRNIAAGHRVTTGATSGLSRGRDDPNARKSAAELSALCVVIFPVLKSQQGGRHGTRAIALAHWHSIADYSSDLGAWRPSRLILLGDA